MIKLDKSHSLKDCAAGESGLLQKKFVMRSLYFMLVVIDGPFEAYLQEIPVSRSNLVIVLSTHG